MKWIISDIDGTLTDQSHRLHLLGPETGECHNRKDAQWEEFNQAAKLDPAKQNIIDLLWMVHQCQCKIALITGRFSKYRELTISWLFRKDVPYDLLLMRNEGDMRSDVDVKVDLLFKFKRSNHIVNSDILFVLEDRDKLVGMWRRLNLTCLQVEKGRY
jgi:uncharacterized HAD superfamily protein